MVVNLYADRLMTTPPASADEVWNATRVHARLFQDAAVRIGLTTKEYSSFRDALLEGRAIYVKLPRHLDAMAGSHHGHAYAVKHVVLTSDVMGWEVALNNGTFVYIPQVCGNLSVLHRPVVAHRRAPHHIAAKPRKIYTAAVKVVPTPAPETQVSLAPPVPPPVVTAVAPAAHTPWWLLVLPFIPFVGGGSHGQPPPCTGGSNAQNVCQSTPKR